MADESFRITIDGDDAQKTLGNLLTSIQSIGSKDNLTGLIAGLEGVGAAAGIIGAAYLALKVTFDSVFDAERVRSINAQFKILTEQSGIATEVLRSGLEKAAGGLVDTTTLLQVANKAIIAMGDDTKKLPLIMDLARKASAVMGTDVASTFTSLTQAIEMGNQKMLKRMGIMVDVKKAEQEWADAHDVSREAMTQSERIQARMNAVLEAGKKISPDIVKSVGEITTSWNQFKVAITEAKEAVQEKILNFVGPALKSIADSLKGWFGKDVAAEAEHTKRRIKEIQEEIAFLQAQIKQGESIKIVGLDLGDQSKAAREEIKKLQDQLRALGVDVQEEGKKEREKTEEQLAQEAKFKTQITKMSEETSKLRIQNETNVKNAVAVIDNEMANLAIDTEAKKQLALHDKSLSKSQRAAAARAEEALGEEKLKALQIKYAEDVEKAKIKAYENTAKIAKSSFDKMDAGAKLSSAKSKKEIQDFSRMGADAVQTFGTTAGSAFEQFGQGTISIGQAMEKAFLGSLGKMAVQEGTKLMLSSVWPPNPLGLSAGAALCAFGGFLESQGGGTSSGGGGGVPSAGSVANDLSGQKAMIDKSLAKTPEEIRKAYDEEFAVTEEERKVKMKDIYKNYGGAEQAMLLGQLKDLYDAKERLIRQEEEDAIRQQQESLSTEQGGITSAAEQHSAAPKKVLTINIQGHYFDTDETRRRLTEIIRNNSDATDFKILSVGGGV
jgi:hypothetical protein